MKIKRNCKYCGEEFYVTKHKIKEGKGLYCCKQCYTDYKNNNSLQKIITDNCVVCGKGIHLTPYLRKIGRKCCSVECQRKLYTKLRTKLVLCKFCNKEIKTKASAVKVFCNHTCRKYYNIAHIPKYTCKSCGIMFSANLRIRHKNHKHYFCSNVCKFAYQKTYPANQKNGKIKRCDVCKTEFYVAKGCSHYNHCSSFCANFSRRGKPNPKGALALSKLVADGKFNPKRNYYKQGYYTSVITNKSEYYGSSYELKRMQQLDNMGVTWTKKHKIIIGYKDEKGKNRYYVPDFLVNNTILEEVKPFRLVDSTIDNNIYKKTAAIEYCRNNGLQFRTITEKELGIKL